MMRRIFLHVPLGPGNVLRNADCLLFNNRPVDNPNAGPVPDKNYDLPMHITLEIHLRFFTIGRRRQCKQAKYAWTHSLGNRADCATPSGGIASFTR